MLLFRGATMAEADNWVADGYMYAKVNYWQLLPTFGNYLMFFLPG